MISLVLESDKLPLANTEAIIYNKRLLHGILFSDAQPLGFLSICSAFQDYFAAPGFGRLAPYLERACIRFATP